MSWNQVINDLCSAGMSERAIRDEVNRRLGTSATSQGSINRLRNSITAEPGWSVGATLLLMHKQAKRKQQQGRAAA